MRKYLLLVLIISFVFLYTLSLQVVEASRGMEPVFIKDNKGTQVGLYKESHALVIGASHYTNGWPKLPGVKNDVQLVGSILKEHGFKVVFVNDPDKVELRDAFENFINTHGQKPENRLLFYFAGHGYTKKLSYGDEMGYIIPIDAPDPEVDPGGFSIKAMDMEQIQVFAKRIQSKHAIFLFDSCFSGSLFALSRAIPKSISYKTSKPVRQFITSGSADETVPDRSTFREQFVAALEGEGDVNEDGYVTGSELGQFLQDTVINYTNESQHPQYGKIRNRNLDKGDFVFALGSDVYESSVQMPSKPKEVEEFGFGNIDEKRQKRREDERKLAELKTEWANWQKRLDSAYDKALEYDKDKYVSTNEKTQVWKRLADSFSQDNPYSTEDQLIRSKAMDRLKYWSNYREPKPAVTTNKEPSSIIAVQEKSSKQVAADSATGMEFVLVKGGCYQMGDQFGDGDDDEKPVHEVCVDDFYMGKYEVTQGEWEVIMGDNPSKFKNGRNYPVEQVSWNDVQGFIRKLNRKTGLSYRLPTEAEWEYAARSGGNREKFAGLSNEGELYRYANFCDSNCEYDWKIAGQNDGYANTSPVGTYIPNDLGIYDMSGNVYELVQDIYSEEAYREHQRNNPIYTKSGSRRVIRGGSWLSKPRDLRASDRFYNSPDDRGYILGFRLARTP
jgi:formylglycine-generating enzyme required for sulfatase activity